VTASVSLYAEMEAVAGSRDRVSALLLAYGSEVRAEPGCLRFEAYQPSDQLDRYFVMERYRDQAAFDVHLSTPHCAEFNAAVEPLIVGGASVLTPLVEL